MSYCVFVLWLVTNVTMAISKGAMKPYKQKSSSKSKHTVSTRVPNRFSKLFFSKTESHMEKLYSTFSTYFFTRRFHDCRTTAYAYRFRTGFSTRSPVLLSRIPGTCWPHMYGTHGRALADTCLGNDGASRGNSSVIFRFPAVR